MGEKKILNLISTKTNINTKFNCWSFFNLRNTCNINLTKFPTHDVLSTFLAQAPSGDIWNQTLACSLGPECQCCWMYPTLSKCLPRQFYHLIKKPYLSLVTLFNMSARPWRHTTVPEQHIWAIKQSYTRNSVLWIRIRIGSIFRSFLDPDPYSEYGSGSTHVNIG